MKFFALATALAVLAGGSLASATLSDKEKQLVIDSVQKGDYSILDLLDVHGQVCPSTPTASAADSSLPTRTPKKAKPAKKAVKKKKKSNNDDYDTGCAPGYGTYSIGCSYDSDGGLVE